MGDTKMIDRPSLDRLKALDSLPDLDSQLTEARSLCDHSAQAEMILRWLMGKLKASTEACQLDRTWSILNTTLRMISPPRIALLLSQLPGILQTTISAQELRKITVNAIAGSLNLLLELGKGTDGAAIKSLLSMESSAAASLCGNWFRHVYALGNEGLESLVSNELLDPALQLWELRKRSDRDDSEFNDHCLVPLLPLLGQLESGSGPNSKRKRGETAPASARAYERALESLVAKHTILPARTSFFRTTDPQVRRAQRGVAQVTIEDTLAPLKKAIETGGSRTLLESTPRVLDIALRSVSTPTPRHRIKERPWIESIVAALRECLVGQDEASQNRALVQLLRSVRTNKSTLPLPTLAALVKDSVDGAAKSGDAVGWELVAAVVELDANVLASLATTNEVFDQITKEHETVEACESKAFQWKEQIILPTMRAYAQSRTLGVFTECWYKQLLALKGIGSWSVWDNIGDSLSDMLETSLAVDTILELIDQYTATVQEFADAKEKLSSEETAAKLRATCCILGSLLKGVQTDTLISSMQSRLDTLFYTLLGLSALKGFKTTVATDCHYWRLLTRVFGLWYPEWASKQSKREAVAGKGVSLLSNKTFKSALTQSTAGGYDQITESAQAYVATLCHCFNQYGGDAGCAQLCVKAIDQMAGQSSGAALVFTQFPDLLATLDSDVRKNMIKTLLESAASPNLDVDESTTQIKAVLYSFQGVNKNAVLEEFVSVAVEGLKFASKKNAPAHEKVFMSIMASINAAGLDQTQRTYVLNTVLALSGPKQDKAGVAQLQCRLALILKLVSLPCQDSRLLTDASAIWDLVTLLEQDTSMEDDVRSDSLDNVHLLEDITRRVMRPWLATQDREKSCELLKQISKKIKDRVKSEKKAGKLSASRAGLVLVAVAIKMIESDARDATKKLMVHREAKTAKAYIDLLATSVEVFASEVDDTSDAEIADCISTLEALLALPDSFIIAAGIEVSQHAERVAGGVMRVNVPRGRKKYWEALAATVFRLRAKHRLEQDSLSVAAMKTIRAEHPSAREQAEVLSAYENNFKESSSAWKLQVTFDVLTRRPETQTVECLMLVQAAINGLTKEDFEKSTIPPTRLLQRNLQAITQDDNLATLPSANQGDVLLARRTALQNLTIFFKDKPFMTNQHGIEQTLFTLQHLLKTCPYPGALYLDITQVLTALFQHHRSRLQGRFHLVLTLLQALLTHLFTASKSASHPELSVRQARALARLLESFSNPPPPRHQRGKQTSDLVDEARKAQAHAGQFTQYLLHHYCSQVLMGSLGEGVREALLPGLWAVIEAMEVYSQDAIKSLSAAVNNSERAVLRSVYEDWKRFGKWEGL